MINYSPVVWSWKTPAQVFCFPACLILLLSCRPSGEDEKSIRGHTLKQIDVPHGLGLHKAERYCQDCHGLRLTGGEGFIPTCYRCHGKNWLDDDPQQIYAPSSHTEQRGLWMHHPEFSQASSTCSECHGNDLTGNPDTGTPSCYLCHEKIWPDNS